MRETLSLLLLRWWCFFHSRRSMRLLVMPRLAQLLLPQVWLASMLFVHKRATHHKGSDNESSNKLVHGETLFSILNLGNFYAAH
jgi:hypothetical protein